MRGYFGVGVEGISKAMNVGSIFRSAHAFGASFAFTVAANYKRAHVGNADTSNSAGQMPFYDFPSLDTMVLPNNCSLIGVELTDDATELPSFSHPQNAVYILGPERGSLSPAMLEKCDYTLKIPTKFCINVGLAAAIVLYDRSISMGRYALRPVSVGGPKEEVKEHEHGGRYTRKKNMTPFETDAPLAEIEHMERVTKLEG